MAATGMRRAEACGLKCSETNLEAASITITVTRLELCGEIYDDTPKSEAGRREIALDTGTIARLKSYRARQAADQLAWVRRGSVPA